MGRFTKVLDREIVRMIDDFERRSKRRITFEEYKTMRDIRRMFKIRLQQIGPTEGSEMFEQAKQSIVGEGIEKISKYFKDLLKPPQPSVLIQNPTGDFVIGEPAPEPEPIPHGYGYPVRHFRFKSSTKYS
jgi:hypothetical protein